VFALVCDVRSPARDRLAFFLRTIRAHAPDARVVLVGAKADSLAETDDAAAQLRTLATSVGLDPAKAFALSSKTGAGVSELKQALASLVPEAVVPASHERLHAALRSEAAELGLPYVLAERAQELGLGAAVGLPGGPDVHAALCQLSGQGALFYSDCRGAGTRSGVRAVRAAWRSLRAGRVCGVGWECVAWFVTCENVNGMVAR